MIDKAELLFNEVLKYINQLSEGQINTNSDKNQLEVSESENYLIYLERMLHEERVEFEVVIHQFFLSSYNIAWLAF